MDIRVDVDGSDADRQVRLLELALTDLQPFWRVVTPMVRRWWKAQFDTEGGFAGHAWTPLSPQYAAWKARHYPGKGILQATGQLKQAASRAQSYATPSTLTMIIDDAGPAHGPVLQYHQEGEGVPRRPLVFGDPLPAIAAAELDLAAERYVRDLLGRV